MLTVLKKDLGGGRAGVLDLEFRKNEGRESLRVDSGEEKGLDEPGALNMMLYHLR